MLFVPPSLSEKLRIISALRVDKRLVTLLGLMEGKPVARSKEWLAEREHWKKQIEAGEAKHCGKRTLAKCELTMGKGCGCIQKRLDKKMQFAYVWDELAVPVDEEEQV